MVRSDPLASLAHLLVGLIFIAAVGGCGDGTRASDPSADPTRVELPDGYPVQLESVTEWNEKLSGDLRRRLRTGSRERVRALVDFGVQLDLRAYGERLRLADPSRLQRRRAILKALRSIATRIQEPVTTVLEELSRRGEVSSYRSYPLLNRLLVEGTPQAMRVLAQRPEVAWVQEETAEPVFGLAISQASVRSGADPVWPLGALGVAEVWSRGLTGEGVVVGIIDAGASSVHEQLAAGYRGGSRSWLDPSGRHDRPTDGVFGHGTSVLSVAVGSVSGGTSLGVAPRAQWIACAGLPGGNLNNVAVTECAEWMLGVGQPDVLINAWVVSAEGCDRSLRRIVEVWRAAEILPVFAAGNLGPEPGSDRSPANYAGLYPGDGLALSVGAHAEDGLPLEHSSRGPGSCDGTTYPAIVAPGAGVRVAFPLTSSHYVVADGTSIAAGFVAGAAALLLQHRPDSWVWELEDALRAGAVDVGDPGPDDVFGHGRLHVPSALAALEATGNR